MEHQRLCDSADRSDQTMDQPPMRNEATTEVIGQSASTPNLNAAPGCASQQIDSPCVQDRLCGFVEPRRDVERFKKLSVSGCVVSAPLAVQSTDNSGHVP